MKILQPRRFRSLTIEYGMGRDTLVAFLVRILALAGVWIAD
jgi:hypothetical protein